MAGREWIIEAYGCNAAALADLDKLKRVFAGLIAALSLQPVGETSWHRFPGAGGITGLCLLAESHLACHTFPEYGTLCLNLFCCRPRPEWDFAAFLTRELAAVSVNVRRIERPYENEPENRQLSELRSADHIPLV